MVVRGIPVLSETCLSVNSFAFRASRSNNLVSISVIYGNFKTGARLFFKSKSGTSWGELATSGIQRLEGFVGAGKGLHDGIRGPDRKDQRRRRASSSHECPSGC